MNVICTFRLHTNKLVATALVALTFLLGSGSSHSQFAQLLPEPAIAERGPNHRVWQRIESEMLPDGKTRNKVVSYTELASGLHRQTPDGSWAESSDVIELVNDHAVARQLPYQVIWAANPNTVGAVDFLTSDGRRLRSHVIGLALYDPTTGQSVMVAELKDRVGELLPPNQIFYRDAFDSINADLVYTVRRDGFFQEVVVHQQIEIPDGFNPQTTRIEVWTEFLTAPEPEKSVATREGISDEEISFGEMRIGPGRAFSLGNRANPARSAKVFKRWLKTEGRVFLIEGVKFRAVAEELLKLPAPNPQAAVNVNKVRKVAQVGPDQRPFPAMRMVAKAKPNEPARRFQVATLAAPRSGFVLDYDLVSATDLVLQADTTYYVSGTVNLTSPVIEGGCVVKFANTNSAKIVLLGTPVWRTGPYRPAIFTARDDHSIGTQIGSANLSGYYAACALSQGSNPTYPIQHIRISHASQALETGGYDTIIRHAQIQRCGTAFLASGGHLSTENVLVHEAMTGMDGNADWSLVHGTVHHCSSLATNYAGGSLGATNTLLIYVTNMTGISTTLAGSYAGDDASAFQTVGAGSHYLASYSAHRDAGTASSISSTLLGDLRRRTTYPPVVLSGTLSADLRLDQQARRDTDVLDQGYHYDALDFIAAGLAVTNATVTVQPGVAVGTYSMSTSVGYGLGLFEGANLIGEGSPTNLNRIVRYNTVQEQATTNWSLLPPSGQSVLAAKLNTTSPMRARFRFTEFSAPAQDVRHFEGSSLNSGTNDIIDCQFHGGGLLTTRPVVKATNSLFNRVALTAGDDVGSYTLNLALRNNSFVGGALWLEHYSADTWYFRDNLIAVTNVYQVGTLDHDYNGYTTNAARLTPTASNDRVLTVTNLAFDAGPLGFFYLPTNLTSHSPLFNNGSTWATNVGLFSFTTTTNQLRETNSVVDLGFHYVAVNGNGLPIDSDGDGLPDYVEDRNGNGVKDSGEGDRSLTDTDGDGISDFMEFLQGRNSTVGALSDTNNFVSLRLHTPLK